MKAYKMIGPLIAATLSYASIAYADDATCKDGTSSKGGRGACSGHGGIAKTPSGKKETVACKDGTSSNGGRGACSSHGGERTTAKRSDPPSTHASPTEDTRPSERTAPAPEKSEGVDHNASGATARCKDGAYSHALHHTGACSRHGGVASWLDK